MALMNENTSLTAMEGAEAAHGISILREIFPDHGKEQAPCPKLAPPPATGKMQPGNDSILQQLLGSIATPARSPKAGSNQVGSLRNGPSCAPPAHAPNMLGPLAGPPAHAPTFAPPTMPPPPPSMPAPQALQEQWMQPRAAAHSSQQEQWMPAQAAPTGALLAPREQGFGSYREMLRAGGRGALQRGIDAGLMPKAMKQDWSAMPRSTAPAQGFLCQQPQVQQDTMMPYAMAEDSQQMWNGVGQMQGSDCWDASYNQAQMPMESMYAQQFQQQHDPTVMQYQMMPQMAMQDPAQMLQMPQCEQSPMCGNMCNMPLELPQMAMSQVQLSPIASGESTPAFSCMSEPEPCDADLMALQLRAAAELNQCYED